MTGDKEPAASDDGATQDLEPIQEALEKLPQEKQQVILERFYSGPIMPPAMLAEIEGIISGGANRVLQITEKEQAHRHRMESVEMATHAWQARISLVGGLLAFGCLIVGIVYCAANGYGWGVTSLAAVAAFGVITQIIQIPARTKTLKNKADRAMIGE
jgi:uncharacterized membrane protein